jgi:hypothetical protein
MNPIQNLCLVLNHGHSHDRDSGLLYMFYRYPQRYGGCLEYPGLEVIAIVHTAGAFVLPLCAHLYLITTGKTVGQSKSDLTRRVGTDLQSS